VYTPRCARRQCVTDAFDQKRPVKQLHGILMHFIIIPSVYLPIVNIYIYIYIMHNTCPRQSGRWYDNILYDAETVRGRPRRLHDIIIITIRVALRAPAMDYYSTNGRREPAPPTYHGR